MTLNSIASLLSGQNLMKKVLPLCKVFIYKMEIKYLIDQYDKLKLNKIIFNKYSCIEELLPIFIIILISSSVSSLIRCLISCCCRCSTISVISTSSSSEIGAIQCITSSCSTCSIATSTHAIATSRCSTSWINCLTITSCSTSVGDITSSGILSTSCNNFSCCLLFDSWNQKSSIIWIRCGCGTLNPFCLRMNLSSINSVPLSSSNISNVFFILSLEKIRSLVNLINLSFSVKLNKLLFPRYLLGRDLLNFDSRFILRNKLGNLLDSIIVPDYFLFGDHSGSFFFPELLDLSFDRSFFCSLPDLVLDDTSLDRPILNPTFGGWPLDHGPGVNQILLTNLTRLTPPILSTILMTCQHPRISRISIWIVHFLLYKKYINIFLFSTKINHQ